MCGPRVDLTTNDGRAASKGGPAGSHPCTLSLAAIAQRSKRGPRRLEADFGNTFLSDFQNVQGRVFVRRQLRVVVACGSFLAATGTGAELVAEVVTDGPRLSFGRRF